MNGHHIRLAGPWICVSDALSIGRDGDLDSAGQRCQLPQEIPAAVQCDAAGLWRRFHRPTGLGQASRVYLLVTMELLRKAEVSDADRVGLLVKLNGHLLTENSASSADGTSSGQLPSALQYRFELTQDLQSFNELQISLKCSPEGHSSPSVLRAAVLEIVEDSALGLAAHYTPAGHSASAE